MRILYLSRSMKDYKAAYYQRDVMDELDKQAEIVFYGPGYSGFDPSKSINKVISELNKDIDLLMVGHAWLSDTPGAPADPFPELRLDKCELPKAIILNKEYTNLEAKLDWIRDKKFFRGFTHHHRVNYYAERCECNFVFWPFAVNYDFFGAHSGIPKEIDFAFSGILQNQGSNARQSDIRVRIMRHLFHCAGDIPVLPRTQYSSYKIVWNTRPRKRWQRRLSLLARRHRYLPDEEYRAIQEKARIYLNTLSPVGLVGTRFAENMATKALVFCEESDEVSRIFPENCFVSFRKDLSDFDEKFFYFLENETARQKIVETAYELVGQQHTWRKRVSDMLSVLRNDLDSLE